MIKSRKLVHRVLASALPVLLAARSIAAINAPTDVYFLCPSPYTQLTLYWTDNSGNETGFAIERQFDAGPWTPVAAAGANATSAVIAGFDRSLSSQFRVVATNATEASPTSDAVRVVGSSATLEVYPEVPRIRVPRTLTNGPIVFSELQDQCPADPAKGKATRISTAFTVEVRRAAGGSFLGSPTYETRPQIRNYLGQNDPGHSGGHRPYSYGNYGPNATKPNRKLHNKHWSNFDASENVVVRITLLPTSTFAGPINLSDTLIHPAPLAVQQVSANVLDVTLPGATDFARHYRVAVNRTAWAAASPDRSAQVIESPLYIFVNPVHLAPASAPLDQIKSFNGGQLVAIGPGIHLPNDTYRFFGENGGNSTCRELYAPGDAYLHYGFVFRNHTYAMKVWGRALYSDELFDVYLSVDPVDYDWSSTNRTPWAAQDCGDGNPWGYNPPWEARVYFKGSFNQQSTFEGFSNIGTRMGVVSDNSRVIFKDHKDVGYGGSTYQQTSGSNHDTLYNGCLLLNDDDITYVHHNYRMINCTTFNLINGPTFQAGWGSFNLYNIPVVVSNHTSLSSDRNSTGFWHNHGVFNSRLDISQLTHHGGGHYENFTLYGREGVVFNLRIWNQDNDTTPNTMSILGDKTYKNINVLQHSYNDNVLWTDANPTYNKQAYIRFLHFDNLVIGGNRVDHIDDGDFFDYNAGALLHTITWFSLPAPVVAPAAGAAPVGKTIVPRSHAVGKHLKMDATLPVSFGPVCANENTTNAGGFTVLDAGGGYVALRATNNYFVKADPKRYGYLYTVPDTARGDPNTTSITDDARFVWVTVNSTNFALYSRSMGLYARVETNCGSERPLYAASATIGPLETFSLPAGTPPPVPLLHIEAEDYSAMSGIQSQEATGEGPGQTNIAFINHGDWAEYALNLPVAGEYQANFRVAAFGTAGSMAGSIELAVGAQSVGSVHVVAAGGGWQDWTNVTTTASFPTSGPQTVRLNFMGASGFLFNVNWFELSTAVPTPANLAWRVPGPNKLILSWPENLGWRLQSQTNSLTQGLGTNWLDLPGAGSPYTNSLDPSAPVVLYRLVHP